MVSLEDALQQRGKERPGARSVDWVGDYFRGSGRRREVDLLEALKGPFRESANHGYRFAGFKQVFVHGDTEDLSQGTRGVALGCISVFSALRGRTLHFLGFRQKTPRTFKAVNRAMPETCHQRPLRATESV